MKKLLLLVVFFTVPAIAVFAQAQASQDAPTHAKAAVHLGTFPDMVSPPARAARQGNIVQGVLPEPYRKPFPRDKEKPQLNLFDQGVFPSQKPEIPPKASPALRAGIWFA